MKRFIIMAKDINTNEDINVFKDQRSFKTLKYAKKRMIELGAIMIEDIGMFIRPITITTICPHCKHDIGGIELEQVIR